MTIIWLTVGFIIGFIVRGSNKKPPVKEKYIRRGLYQTQYQITKGREDRPAGNIDTVFEVGEIECTDTLSKIEVISVKTNLSEYNNSKVEQDRLICMVDNSWIKSSEITWITTVVEKRNNKIDEILN